MRGGTKTQIDPWRHFLRRYREVWRNENGENVQKQKYRKSFAAENA
jgi:hypothetical protein